ncbi:MAG TPA: two-component regulator propeller domain-containing protein [Candidatus Acidoferrales bacterium]|jgi:signal transduction histidine kinase/ligand-binding sensor domain-containing protein|nr:two-component regulator propeller domain-containing protein [Candidatus Acidoferrales bacterium]
MRARGQSRGIVALGAVLTGILLASRPCAFALNPTLDVSQYAHTAWKIRDGFVKGSILSIAQTPDGYLWVGTAFGLSRFDGVRNVAWEPPPNQHLPSTVIARLVAARDGTLWIGTFNGLASWKNGKLIQYAEFGGLQIRAVVEDHEGSIWVGTNGPPDGKLCEIRNGSVRCYPEMGGVGHGVFGLHEDGKGNLWAGLEMGAWRWRPGQPEFYSVPGLPNGRMQGMTDGEDGALLIATTGAVMRPAGEKAQVVYPFPAARQGFRVLRMLRDRDGGLWVGPAGRGIVHIHQGRTDVFSQLDGLSGDDIYDLFEDREGNIWVGTINGLDRFRELPVLTYSRNQGLSEIPWAGLIATREGSVWFATLDGLNRLNKAQVTVYRRHRARAGVREIAGSGLPDEGVGSLFQDSRGRIWVSTLTGIGYMEHDRFIPVAVPGGVVGSLTEDPSGNLWIANRDLGLFRLSPRNELQRIPWAAFSHKDPAVVLAPDPVQGGLWLGFSRGGVAWFRDGQIHSSYSAGEGLGEGRVNDLRFDDGGALWIATEGGLSRLKNGHIARLTSKNGLPCDAVQWTIKDAAQSVWLMMPCGLVRVARSELDAWAMAADKTASTIRATVFDSSDGLRTFAVVGDYTPRAAESPDGNLWFIAPDGISVVDPRHLLFNKLPPPVHIEQIMADGKKYDPNTKGRLPPLVRDLEIEYTALSLVAPERNRFRHKLEGWDADWQETTERRAVYSNLPPRSYRFRVRASNNSDVWDEAGASFDFSIAPAYYQTTWFLVACIAAGLAMLAALYRLRLRYLKQQFNLRMEERIGERTRIARDLHDTLLQSFQGLLMKFSAATYMIPQRPVEAQKTLERAIEQARQAVTEGRDAVQALRASTVVTNDLVRAITTLGEQLATEYPGASCPEPRVQVQGTSRELAPIVRDEVYRIAYEAVRNVCRHAQASRIDVEILYGDRHFRLRVRDDGKGIDPKVLAEGGRAGHHGLPGMQERANLAGGKLVLSSKPGSGTEAELTIPAAFAYVKSPAARRSISAGKGIS